MRDVLIKLVEETLGSPSSPTLSVNAGPFNDPIELMFGRGRYVEVHVKARSHYGAYDAGRIPEAVDEFLKLAGVAP